MCSLKKATGSSANRSCCARDRVYMRTCMYVICSFSLHCCVGVELTPILFSEKYDSPEVEKEKGKYIEGKNKRNAAHTI